MADMLLLLPCSHFIAEKGGSPPRSSVTTDGRGRGGRDNETATLCSAQQKASPASTEALQMLVATFGLSSGVQGGGYGMASTKFIDPEKHVSYKLGHGTASRWRLVDDGLNLATICITPDCPAFRQYVYVPVGVGHFNIIEKIITVECPICHQQAEDASNMGFRRAKFVITGIKENREKVKVEGQTNEGEYYTFDSTGSCQWLVLKAEVEIIQQK